MKISRCVDTNAPHAGRVVGGAGYSGGFTFIEVVLSTLLTGLVIVAALNTLGAASRASLDSSHRARATALANDLLAEILNQPYLDPGDSPEFGPESDESTSTRLDFDDVDDYDEWNESPPRDKAGNDLPNGTGWRRVVRVNHYDPDNPTQTLADSDDRGLKGVIVSVRYNGAVLVRLISATTSAWPLPVE